MDPTATQPVSPPAAAAIENAASASTTPEAAATGDQTNPSLLNPAAAPNLENRDPPVEAPLSTPRTQARVERPAKEKPGARRRKSRATPATVRQPGERVGIVMLTSKVTGPDGRAVARRTAVWAPDLRAIELIEKEQARFANAEETATATITLD